MEPFVVVDSSFAASFEEELKVSNSLTSFLKMKKSFKIGDSFKRKLLTSGIRVKHGRVDMLAYMMLHIGHAVRRGGRRGRSRRRT